MKKVVCLLSLTLLLLTAGVSSVRAEEKLPDRLQKLADETYRHYSARETDQFFEDVNKVKVATEFSDYQETYYRACSYEAIYMFEYVDRKQWALALKRTDKLIHQQNRCAQKASIYEHMGDLKQALAWQKKAREVIDSIQSPQAHAEPSDDLTKMCIIMK